LNLTQTSSHDWHVQLFVKDPLQVRTGRPLRIMTAHNLTVLSVVLETFQTYYAFSRAVNPILRSTGRLRRFRTWRLALSIWPTAKCQMLTADLAEQTRNMPLRPALSTKVSAHKGTRAFEIVKDLVLEVPRFPLTCRRTLSSTSSPVAGAATTELYCLGCQLLLQDSKHLHPLATTTPLADFSFITEQNRLRNPRHSIFAQNLGRSSRKPHQHWRFRAKKILRAAAR
jgi:hypothetical protein